MWNLESALETIREIEKKLSPHWHCGLAGGVMLRGFSEKDLDVIIYPHNKGHAKQPITDDAWRIIYEMSESFNNCSSVSQMRDAKDVRWITKDGKRIDIFFLE